MTTASCAVCGTVFTKNNWRQIHCSEKCTRYRQAELRRTRNAAQRTEKKASCKTCGTEFVQRTRNHVYCSESCRRKPQMPCRVCGRVGPLTSGLCNAHYMQTRRHGEVTGEQIGGPRTKTPAYGTVHDRLRAKRGKVTDYSCEACGQMAHDWAFDNNEPYWIDPASGRRYYDDLVRYRPLCRNCHRAADGFPHCPHGNDREVDGRGRCRQCKRDWQNRYNRNLREQLSKEQS